MTALSRLANPRHRHDGEALRRAVDGKTVVVTGASHGIGREVARQVAAAGGRCLLVARTADVLDELADEIGAESFPCDLADQTAVEQLCDDLLAATGRVDVVVSNAGKSIRRSVADSYDRMHDFTRLIDINYLGPVRLLLGLLPSMRSQGAGHVVNVSTIGVLLPPAPRWAGYVSSKAAFDRWLRCAATEIAEDGVHVSSIYLGLVHTRMSAPTAEFKGMPGLSPAQAAAVVARALIERPRTIAPWWATTAGAFGELARGTSEMAMRRYGRRIGERHEPTQV